MITKIELLKKLDDPSYGIEELILWANSLPDDDGPLNQNHAGSNEPGFDPKKAQDLSQKQTMPDPVVLDIAARFWIAFHDKFDDTDDAAVEAYQLVDSVLEEEARRAGK